MSHPDSPAQPPARRPIRWDDLKQALRAFLEAEAAWSWEAGDRQTPLEPYVAAHVEGWLLHFAAMTLSTYRRQVAPSLWEAFRAMMEDTRRDFARRDGDRPPPDCAADPKPTLH